MSEQTITREIITSEDIKPVTALVNVLIKKNVVTKEEIEAMRKEMAEEANKLANEELNNNPLIQGLLSLMEEHGNCICGQCNEEEKEETTQEAEAVAAE